MAFWIGGLIVLLVDRLTKFIVVQKMNLGETIPVIKDFLHITYIENPGAAFGLLANKTWLFIFFTVVILIGMVYLNQTMGRENFMFSLILGLVAGGAVGNLIDRFQSGLVVDFIDFRGIWPYVFNIADTAIVIGMLLLIWQIIVSEKL